MNKRGEITTGIVLVTFIGILVALILYEGSLGFIGTTTRTESLANGTYTAPAAASTIDVLGQELLSTPIVTNATGGEVVPTSNYTIQERVSTVDGLKRISYTSLAGEYAGQSVNLSYSYGAEGYADDAGARAIIPLIAILAALAVAVFTLVPTLRSGVLNIK